MYPYCYYLSSYSNPFDLTLWRTYGEGPGGLRKGRRGGDILQGVRMDGGLRALPGQVPQVGSGNSPLVGGATQNVPPCHMVQGWKEAECMFCQGHRGSVPEPEPRADQSAMELVGY